MQQFDLTYIDLFKSQREQLLGGGLERLPHAMLLVGPEGLGKSVFGERLAHLLLCESPTGHAACGKCQSCHWLAGGNHPDYRLVRPSSNEEGEEGVAEKGKKRSPGIIRIDQIRELESFVFVGSHRMGRRVVLLTGAEAMNAAAANSLLKILEEPPSSVYFILTSSNQRFLLPTIRSRCRVLTFSAPDLIAAREILAAAGIGKTDERFLDLAGGAPIRLIGWKESGALKPIDRLIGTLTAPAVDPISLAASWDGLLKSDPSISLDQLVEELQRWVFDLAQERIAGGVHYHQGWPRPKEATSTRNPSALINAWQELKQFRRSSRHPLNQLLFLESMANLFVRATRPAAA